MPASERLQHLVRRFEEKLGREVEPTGREINAVLYGLYGLTEEEVKIVSEL